MKFRFCLIFALTYIACVAQETSIGAKKTDKNYIDFETIKKEYPLLSVPKNLEKPVLQAIRFYPELKKTTIKIVYRNTKTTMETRPSLLSLFCTSRKYNIYVDNYVKNGNGILIKEVPYRAKVGVFGHELAHIIDYEKTSLFGIIKLGFRYLIKNDIDKFEKRIDRLTIEKGLGDFLKEWSDYVLNKSKGSTTYKAYKRKNYLTPQEIDDILLVLAQMKPFLEQWSRTVYFLN